MRVTNITIATAWAVAVGLLLWMGWWRWHLRGPLNPRLLFASVLGVGILCRIAFVFLTPIFYAPDELPHFNYIKYLAENHSFPVMTSKVGDASNDWEYFQPPLYYLAMVPIYGVAESTFHNQTVTVLALRSCSVLLWLLNMLFGFELLKRLQIKDELLQLSAITLPCLLPTYTFVSSTINNDNLAATMGGAVLCLIVGRERSLGTSLSLGLLVGLALLTKQSAVVFLPAILLLSVLDGFQRRTKWSVIFSHLVLVIGAAALVYFPCAVRNWHLYDTFFPEHLSSTPKAWPSIIHGIASAGHNLIKSFCATSGISNDIGYPLSIPGMIIIALSFTGLVVALKQKTIAEEFGDETRLAMLMSFALSILVGVLLILRFGYLYGMGQGRHLFPLLHPIALLLACGLCWLSAKISGVHVAGFWIAYAGAFLVFSFCLFP